MDKSVNSRRSRLCPLRGEILPSGCRWCFHCRAVLAPEEQKKHAFHKFRMGSSGLHAFSSRWRKLSTVLCHLEPVLRVTKKNASPTKLRTMSDITVCTPLPPLFHECDLENSRSVKNSCRPNAQKEKVGRFDLRIMSGGRLKSRPVAEKKKNLDGYHGASAEAFFSMKTLRDSSMINRRRSVQTRLPSAVPAPARSD